MLRALLILGCLLQGAVGFGQLPDSAAAYRLSTDIRRVHSYTTNAGACMETLVSDSTIGVFREYYPSGLLKSYAPFVLSGTRRIPYGVATSWYENGQLWTRQTYNRGQLEGEFLVYYPSGALKRQTSFLHGKELIGNCFGPEGEPLAYFIYEVPPLYPGGGAMLKKDLTRRLRLPYNLNLATKLELLTQGIAVIFRVAEDGSIQEPRVLGGLAAILEAAVTRAVYELPKAFRPGWRDGQPVAAYYRVDIEFGTLPNMPANGRIW